MLVYVIIALLAAVDFIEGMLLLGIIEKSHMEHGKRVASEMLDKTDEYVRIDGRHSRKDAVIQQYRKLAKKQAACEKFAVMAYEDPCDEARAKEALREFFGYLIKCEPDKEADKELDKGSDPIMEYCSYIVRMLPLRNALKQEKYGIACLEIGSIFHHEAILQSRIYYYLIHLYRTYVEEK